MTPENHLKLYLRRAYGAKRGEIVFSRFVAREPIAPSEAETVRRWAGALAPALREIPVQEALRSPPSGVWPLADARHWATARGLPEPSGEIAFLLRAGLWARALSELRPSSFPPENGAGTTKAVFLVRGTKTTMRRVPFTSDLDVALQAVAISAPADRHVTKIARLLRR